MSIGTLEIKNIISNYNMLKASFLWIIFFFFFFGKISISEGEDFSKRGIVSLKPNITEILFALGMGNRLVGVTKYCDFPKEAQKIKKVADYIHINVESVMALQPELVIGSFENSIEKEVSFLEKEGSAVFLYPFGTLSETYTSILEISRIGEEEKRGDLLIKEMKEKLQLLALALNKEGGNSNRHRLLVVVGLRPLVVVGSNNLIDDILLYFGISNVARGSRLSFPTYSLDKLIASQPTVIIDLTMGSEKKNSAASLKWYSQFSSMPAVKNNQIHFLDVADFRGSPRLVKGAEALVEIFSTLSKVGKVDK